MIFVHFFSRLLRQFARTHPGTGKYRPEQAGILPELPSDRAEFDPNCGPSAGFQQFHGGAEID
jgi:hypothetical protein